MISIYLLSVSNGYILTLGYKLGYDWDRNLLFWMIFHYKNVKKHDILRKDVVFVYDNSL